MSERRPNILFAFADDWGRYASPYARVEGSNSLSALLDTPNFERVVDEGVMFTNAFVTAPSCTPCRSSLHSGRYWWQTGLGAILQGAIWDESIPSYPLLLEQAGYHVGFTYKAWSPGRPLDAPHGGARTRYASAGSAFCQFSQNATKRAETMGVEAAKASLLDEVRANFDTFLDARPEGAPFSYWWGPTNTHRRWTQGSGEALWGLNPDDLEGRLPDFLPDVPEVREDVCDYLGECLAVDAGLGVLLERLEEMGELENTLVVVSGDHGIPGFPRGKCNLYNMGCEVALGARWPGQIPAGRVVDDFVNLMDLAPTFLEACGEQPDPGMTARSFLDVLTSEEQGQVDPERTWVITGRERHVGHARPDCLPYPQRSLRTADFLYIRNFEPDRWPMGDPKGLDDPSTEPPDYGTLTTDTFVAYPDMDAGPTKAWMIHHRGDAEVEQLYAMGFGKFPAEELYDLRVDRWYMHNVIDDPAYAADRERLSQQLMAELVRQADPRVIEPDCRFEREPYAGEPEGWN